MVSDEEKITQEKAAQEKGEGRKVQEGILLKETI